MAGSIGDIAEQVLAEVRNAKLTKIAQHNIIKEAQSQPVMQTDIGKMLLKLADEVRNCREEDITMGDLADFLSGVDHAIRNA